jgi:hypothetical protein
LKGFAFYVELEYENVPAYCSYCKVIGHHVDFCKRWCPDEEAKQDNATKKQQNRAPNKSFVQKKDDRAEQGKGKEVIDVEKETLNVEEMAGKEGNDEGKGTTQELEKSSSKITSPAELLKSQDLQLEVELNANWNQNIEEEDQEDTSSQGSYVDATQVQSDTIPEGEEEEVQNKEDCNVENDEQFETPPTPIRVQKDMEFLRNSWAALADNEDEEAGLFAALESEPLTNNPTIDNERFQMHMSKSKKKAQNKQTSREAYTTRSKVSKHPSQ